MAVLLGVHALGLVALGGQIQQLLVDLHELGIAAGVAHVVGVVIQGEGRAEELGVGGGVDLQLGDAALGGVVDALGGGKVAIPIPVLAGVLLHKFDGLLDLVGGVVQHVRLLVAQRGGKLEGRDAVLPLQALGDDAVAHEGAVAGGVVLHRAAAQHAEVVLNGDAGLGLGHGADVAGDAVELSHVQIVHDVELVEDVGGEHGGHFAEDGVHLLLVEAHHEGDHGVLVGDDALVGIGLVVAHPAVAPEAVGDGLGHVGNDEVEGGVGDAQRLIPQTHGELVHAVGHEEVAHHPAVAEKALDVPGHHDEAAQHAHQIKPAGVVIEGVLEAAPLTAGAHLQLVAVDLAGGLLAGALAGVDDFFDGLHAFPPFWIFLISMLSTKAWTRVRIWPPADAML